MLTGLLKILTTLIVAIQEQGEKSVTRKCYTQLFYTLISLMINKLRYIMRERKKIKIIQKPIFIYSKSFNVTFLHEALEELEKHERKNEVKQSRVGYDKATPYNLDPGSSSRLKAIEKEIMLLEFTNLKSVRKCS